MCYYVNRYLEQLLKGVNPLIQFTQNLKQLREAHGLSRQELADMAGISSAAIGYYETGKREPQASTLVSIADALHVSVDDLLGYHVDDFGKAAALFNEATGEAAVLNGDQVKVIRHVAGQEWTFKKDTFVDIINKCVDTFNRTVRLQILRTSFLDALDKAYMKENFTATTLSLLLGTITDKEEALLRNSITDMQEAETQQELSTRKAIFKQVFVALLNKYRPIAEQQLKKEQPSQAAPTAPDHDTADDKPATEKGPHSKE